MQAYSSNSSGSNSNSGGAKASYSPFFTPAKFLEQTLADSSSSLSATTTTSTAAAARRLDKEEEEDSNRFVWQAILFNSDLAKVADDSMSGQNHRYEPYEVPSHQQPPQNQRQQSGSRQPSYIHYHPNGVVAPSGSAPGSLASSASGSLGGASTSSKATPSTPLDALQQLRQRSSATYEGKPACDHCRRRKIRCDRAQPSCGTCVKLGRVCQTNDVLMRRGPPSNKEKAAYQEAGLSIPSLKYRHRARRAQGLPETGKVPRPSKSKGKNSSSKAPPATDGVVKQESIGGDHNDFSSSSNSAAAASLSPDEQPLALVRPHTSHLDSPTIPLQQPSALELHLWGDQDDVSTSPAIGGVTPSAPPHQQGQQQQLYFANGADPRTRSHTFDLPTTANWNVIGVQQPSQSSPVNVQQQVPTEDGHHAAVIPSSQSYSHYNGHQHQHHHHHQQYQSDPFASMAARPATAGAHLASAPTFYPQGASVSMPTSSPGVYAEVQAHAPLAANSAALPHQALQLPVAARQQQFPSVYHQQQPQIPQQQQHHQEQQQQHYKQQRPQQQQLHQEQYHQHQPQHQLMHNGYQSFSGPSWPAASSNGSGQTSPYPLQQRPGAQPVMVATASHSSMDGNRYDNRPNSSSGISVADESIGTYSPLQARPVTSAAAPPPWAQYGHSEASAPAPSASPIFYYNIPQSK